jgi:cobalt-zinc-cadmium efflux system membrane fusion protein
MTTRAFKRRRALALLFGLVLLPACRTGDEAKPSSNGAHDEKSHADGTEGEHAGEGEPAEDLVRVAPAQLERLGITVQEARPGTIDSFSELPGEVRPNGDSLAHVVPRYPGIVREVRKTVGDSVRAGEVLAVVESSESLATYQLTAAIDGVVIDKHLTRGEAIDRETGAFLVADLRNVWVDLAVYQKDLDNVSRGQAVRISAGKEVPPADGTISYITPTVDAPTRTATARVVLSNVDGHWRPGMFITARVLAPVQARLVVPLSAIQTFEGSPVVFVETPDGFIPRPVTLGVRGETQVAVLSGLAPGERYVTNKSFLLKAELGKGEAEHEH